MALAGCTDRGGGAEDGAPPVTVAPTSAAPPAKRCRPRPAGRVLSAFEAGECGAALIQEDETLGLWSLSFDDAEHAASGPAPEACTRTACTYLGHGGPLGPMVLAVTDDGRSEMPAGVWLGISLDPEASRLVFFDLWAGAEDTVVGDGTDLGPAHSLAPFVCDGQLGLFAVGRLAAARDQPLPSGLVTRQGIYTWEGAAPKRVPGARDGCTALALELP